MLLISDNKYSSIGFVSTSAGILIILAIFILSAKKFRLKQMILQLLLRPFQRPSQLHFMSLKREPILSLKNGCAGQCATKILSIFS